MNCTLPLIYTLYLKYCITNENLQISITITGIYQVAKEYAGS